MMVKRVVLFAMMLIGLGAMAPASAQLTWNQVLNFKAPTPSPAYAPTLLAKQGADECFDGIGVNYPPINADGTCDVGTPKKNLAYVWGLAQAGLGVTGFSGDQVWFGTVANPLCGGSATGLVTPQPTLNQSWVCEYGESELARRPVDPLPGGLGDWREPRAFSYNTTTHQLTDRTPLDVNFQSILGLRSAGSIGSEVIMAGPTFNSNVTFASWDASSGSYHGSCRATALNQIRQWITVNGVLYAGAGRPTGDGVLLRWVGSITNPWAGAATVSDYCGFQVVGVLPSFPSYLANYGGKRIAASAWNQSSVNGDDGPAAPATTKPQAGSPTYSAGVYLGPAFGADGVYTTDDATATWTRIWAPAQYEQDPVVAETTGGGAITYWQGWLWFGSMQNDESAEQLHAECTKPACYGPPANATDAVNLLFNVSRASSIWRARTTSTGLQVQLLYGETQLPALVPGTKTFAMKPTGWTPLYGHSGFNNPFLTYSWAVSAGSNDLIFGLYDYRYTLDIHLGIVNQTNVGASVPSRFAGAIQPGTAVLPQNGYGGDLWRFTDADSPAIAENVDGLGNWTNYGFRNMLRLDNGPNVIVGTASGLNLEPLAGWELQYLTPLSVTSKAQASPAGR